MTDNEINTIWALALGHAARFRAGIGERPQRPQLQYAAMLERFAAPTPETGASPEAVIAELVQRAEPGLHAMIGPRFFGWVIGATDPVGVAADWLAAAWGQNAGNNEGTPAAAAVEAVASRWLLDILGLPAEASVGFVTGATMANFTCLAAARGEVLRRAGWDCEADGLFGAPEIKVMLGEDAHSTVFSALRYLGLGDRRVIRVPVDKNGCMHAHAFADAIAGLEGPIIAIAQAGHIHSGGFDPFNEIVDAAHAKGAWVHVDGAFGLWAKAAPDRAHLAVGVERAESWATDGHKWLQTPHDCGYAIIRDNEAHARAMRIAASYLPSGGLTHIADLVPELSRRARGFPTWAMLKALGREGVAQMVSRHCALARRMADRLGGEPDIEIMNDVVLNQVAVRLGSDLPDAEADALTQRAIARIQREGTCFVAGANWRGREIMRVSVISAPTQEADIDRAAEAILAAWRVERATGAA